MSRVGKLPVTLPSGVTLTVAGDTVQATGPKGSLQTPLLEGVKLDVQASQVIVTRDSDEALLRARHGLMRALINNMVVGVSQGFEKKLEIIGVGFRVQPQGNELKFNLGYSHDINYKVPDGVQVLADQNIISVSGANKQMVGQVAAEIRALRKPEPYKGKGIKYVDERILRKSGKSGKE